MKLDRYWINQPSKNQPGFRFHGQNVLACKTNDPLMAEVWFTSGDWYSVELPWLSLSKGWLDDPKLGDTYLNGEVVQRKIVVIS